MPEATSLTPDVLRRHVAAVLDEIPPDKTTALLGYYDLTGAWRWGWAWRRQGSSWMCAATIGQDIARGNVSGGVYLRYVR